MRRRVQNTSPGAQVQVPGETFRTFSWNGVWQGRGVVPRRRHEARHVKEDERETRRNGPQSKKVEKVSPGTDNFALESQAAKNPDARSAALDCHPRVERSDGAHGRG